MSQPPSEPNQKKSKQNEANTKTSSTPKHSAPTQAISGGRVVVVVLFLLLLLIAAAGAVVVVIVVVVSVAKTISCLAAHVTRIQIVSIDRTFVLQMEVEGEGEKGEARISICCCACLCCVCLPRSVWCSRSPRHGCHADQRHGRQRRARVRVPFGMSS